MTERPALLQLSHTHDWVPKFEALGEAKNVYTEFGYNWDCVEDTAKLSAVLRSPRPNHLAKELFDEELVIRLVKRNYLVSRLGITANIAGQVTLKSKIAVNMIVPDLEEGSISGHLVEPFVGREIFPDLHRDYLRTINDRREKDLKDKGLVI